MHLSPAHCLRRSWDSYLHLTPFGTVSDTGQLIVQRVKERPSACGAGGPPSDGLAGPPVLPHAAACVYRPTLGC